MANTFITPDLIARMALATLYNDSVMLPLVTRDYEADLTAAQGDTVTIRKPAVFTANTYNQAVGISLQNATETSTSVVLDTIYDVSIPLTSKDQTLEVTDFQEQIIQPAMEAIAQSVDTLLLSLRSDIVHEVTAAAYNASTNPHPLFDLIAAGRTLKVNKVPDMNRAAVVDPYIAAQWKMDQLANAADVWGDPGTALHTNAISKSFGFDVYESNHITDFNGFAFHPSAFSFVSRPLALPKGAVSASVVSYKGLSIRVVQDYDPTYKQDIISLDLLCGAKTLDANRAVLINGLADSV